MSENLGSGLKLTEDWDIDVDNTGDLATVSGEEELQKDAAMITAVRLEQKLGATISSRLDNNSLKDVELLAKRTLQSDERIHQIIRVEAKSTDYEDHITLEADVTTDTNTNYELVIEVTP